MDVNCQYSSVFDFFRENVRFYRSAGSCFDRRRKFDLHLSLNLFVYNGEPADRRFHEKKEVSVIFQYFGLFFKSGGN